MRLTHRSEMVVVYDDVLPGGVFATLVKHLDSCQYTSVHAGRWSKVFRLHDGNPLRADPGYHFRGAEVPETPLGPLIEAVLAAIERPETLVPGNDTWARLSYSPWLYPRGASLSMHQDGLRYAGAFAFYAHPQWRVHWGGQLVVLDPDPEAPPDALITLPSFLRDDTEDRRALEPGLGLTVLPRPNRLCFIHPTARHLITRVDANAGQHPRVSIAGFFHPPEG